MKKLLFLLLLSPIFLLGDTSFEKKLESCERGNFMLCYTIANEYLAGVYGENKTNEAIKLYEKTCSISCADSCTGLGLLYFDGIKVDKDLEKSKEFLSNGCELGSQYGCMKLANIYEQEQNIGKAKELLKDTCLKGRFQPACNEYIKK